MRPAETLHAQIRWDARLDERRFAIGIDVHAEAPKVVPFTAFDPHGDIPWHRIRFILFDGRPCWDRATGLDTVDTIAEQGEATPGRLRAPWHPRHAHHWDGSRWQDGSCGPPAGELLTVLTWNVLWDRFEAHRLNSAARWPLLLDRALASEADLIAFQEVDPAFHRLVCAHPEVRERWWVSHTPGHPDIGDRDLLLLGRVAVDQVAMLEMGAHKGALAAVLPTPNGPLLVATTHLSSDHRTNAAAYRARELTTLLAGLQDRPAVLLGDFNLHQEGEVLDLVDLWTQLEAPAPTFDPTTNPLAAIGSRSGRPARLDRVLAQGGPRARKARRLGTGAVEDVWLSDHMGVLVTLGMGEEDVHMGEASVRSALAWLPAAVPDALDAVRRGHDPAFPRWPAHINLLWGFLSEHHLDDAAPLLERTLLGRTPFETRLDATGRFGRGRSATHHLLPSDSTAWLALHRAVAPLFPNAGRRGPFHPHLTVARGAPPEGLPELVGLTGVVDELVWMTRRAQEPFRVRARFPLGRAMQVLRDAPIPITHAAPVDGLLRSIDGPVTLVGSRLLGVARAGADIDLVWHEPGTTLPAVAERLVAVEGVEALAQVEKNGLQGLRFLHQGLAVDVVVVTEDGPSAREALTAAPDALHLANALGEDGLSLLRTVKAWAVAQDLDDPVLGGLEGLAWAVLVAATPGPATFQQFVEHWASWDWDRPVGHTGPAPCPVAIYTPTAPHRPITRRALRHRLEEALFQAWTDLEQGVDPLSPRPWHRQHGRALVVRWRDPHHRGHIRGRLRGLFDRFAGLDPWQFEHGIALALPGEDEGVEMALGDQLAGSAGVASCWNPAAEVASKPTC